MTRRARPRRRYTDSSPQFPEQRAAGIGEFFGRQAASAHAVMRVMRPLEQVDMTTRGGFAVKRSHRRAVTLCCRAASPTPSCVRQGRFAGITDLDKEES